AREEAPPPRGVLVALAAHGLVRAPARARAAERAQGGRALLRLREPAGRDLLHGLLLRRVRLPPVLGAPLAHDRAREDAPAAYRPAGGRPREGTQGADFGERPTQPTLRSSTSKTSVEPAGIKPGKPRSPYAS